MRKIDSQGIFKGYISTLSYYPSKKISKGDIAIQIGLPIVAGIAFFVFWPLGEKAIEHLSSDITTCISIISALLCNVAVLLFQLRYQMSTQDNPEPTPKETTLIDYMFHDVLWAVFVGFVSVIVLVIGNSVGNSSFFGHVLISIVISFLCNFVLVTCICIKRLNFAYGLVIKYMDINHKQRE